MKIVGFEADGKQRLGVIEGDQVIDLQAVDPNLSSNLADVLAKNEWRSQAAGRACEESDRPRRGVRLRD